MRKLALSSLFACVTLAFAMPAGATEDFSTGTGEQLAAAATTMGGSQLAAVTFEAATPAIGTYKTDIARRIAEASKARHTEDLPPILKSVVVLDISVDKDGKPVRVVVWRSNGYEDLEAAALASVKSIGVFPPPSEDLLAGSDTVRYLETFLFRPDGRFQIRSLERPVMPSGANPVARKF